MKFAPLVRILIPPAKPTDEAKWFVARLFVYLGLSFLGFFLLIRSVPAAATPAVISTAWLSTQLLRLFGQPAILRGITMELPGFHFTIIYECTAIYSSLIYLSCILAYPAPLKRKASGVAWGIPIIAAVNILRVALLAFTGSRYPQYFEVLHGYFWQVTIILAVVALWVLWLMRISRDG